MEPIRFLNAFAQALSAMTLYQQGHPAQERAIDDLFHELRDLLRDGSVPVFCFLEKEVVYQDRPLHGLKSWTLGSRLAAKEIQRVEFRRGVDRDELKDFLHLVFFRLHPDLTGRPEDRPFPHVQFGPIEVGPEAPLDLRETIEAVDWLHAEAQAKGRISTSLARGIVQTLSSAMRQGRTLLLPLLPLKQVDEYTTVHAMNSSVLVMGLAEFLHLGGGDIRKLGEAALLHDVGKVFVPREILSKPGRLSAEEWEMIRRHPVEGARLLLKSTDQLELAAVVAYEHHLTWQGNGGYPPLLYPRRPHPASRLVQICDVYDACRTRRPFRDALSAEQALRELDTGAGKEFDPQFTLAFVRMMQHWASRIVTLEGTAVSGTAAPDAPSPPPTSGRPPDDPLERPARAV